MAGEHDGLLRFPLPAGFSDEPPAARITVNPIGTPDARDFTPYKGPEALGFEGPPAAVAPPAAAPAPPAASQSPLTTLDPAMFPAAPAAAPGPAPVLQPVEHDPFAQTLKPPPQSQLLIPVDYDPFSPNDMAALRTRMSVMAKGAPVGVDIAGRAKGFKNLDDALLGRNGQERFQTFPERWARAAAGEFGRAAEGQFPDTVYVPVGGNVSDEDLSRRFNDMNAGAEGASNFAMMGGPLQMIARGPKSFGAGNVLSSGGAQPPAGKPAKPAPPFYSAVEQTVADSTLKSATPEQWLGTLKNAKGVKGEELDWLGLPDWLAEQKGPVSKQQVADYVRDHKVELKEVRKFDDESDGYMDAVMDRASDMQEKWTKDAARLGRGEGITVDPNNGRRGGVLVKVDGETIGQFPDHERAEQYARDFRAEALAEATKLGHGDFMDFSHEAAQRGSADLQAKHGAEGRVLPGGENYREILLTLPEKVERMNEPAYIDAKRRQRAGLDYDRGLVKEIEALQAPDNFRVSGHWTEPNVLAWSRVNDRTIDGKKALFIEEVQSDWHQRGREHGYKPADGGKIADKITADRDSWIAENGLTDERGRILWDRMTPEQDARVKAWNAAAEAQNPAVYELSLKARESRLARTNAHEAVFQDAVRSGVPDETLRLLEKHGIELPTSMRGVTDLVGGEYITSTQANKILNAAQNKLDGPEIHAIADRAEADQRALEAAARQNIGGVPDAPLKKGWHEMVLKRMIREAAEHGYDKVAWTTGTQQNTRWQLSSHVKEIEYHKLEDGSYALSVTARHGADVELPKSRYKPEELDELVGKEVADKIREGKGKWYRGHGSSRTLEGLDLEMGGQGMKGFYDKMMVDAANKIAKPHGGKVTSGKIETGKFNPKDLPAGQQIVPMGGGYAVIDANGGMLTESFPTYVEALKNAPGIKTASETVHTLDITPTLRDAAVGKGFPLFMGGVPVSRVQHDPFAEDERNKGPAAK